MPNKSSTSALTCSKTMCHKRNESNICMKTTPNQERLEICNNYQASLRRAAQLSKPIYVRETQRRQFTVRCCGLSFNMKLLAFVLINRILMIATGGSEAADDDDTLSENDLNDNFMYLYKTNTQSENYLNYRAVYGLRFDQKKRDRGQKPIKVFPDNYSVVDQELSFNDTDRHSNEVISTSVNDLEEVVSDELASSSFESETSSQRNETSNFTISEVEPVADESRKHIMRPNNRVEHALDFLAHRLKQLLKHSTDKARPESKISPHLSSLGRFLNLFSLVRFENVPCLTAMKPLRQLSGTCYSEGVCIELGGIAVDQCAEGFGVCCICEFIDFSPLSRSRDKKIFSRSVKAGCRSVTHQNVTYFESPGFPLTSQGNLGTCVTTILLARGVKQLLVEFLFFELLPPTDGNCLDDRLVVVGQAMNFKVPVLCGVATGQHSEFSFINRFAT